VCDLAGILCTPSSTRAHSRLHQAAALACSSIKAVIRTQQQADRVVEFLEKYGHHASSVQLDCNDQDRNVFHESFTCTLQQLPHAVLQGVSALRFSGSGLRLQLQPGNGFQGVLGPGLPLKQLQINKCTLIDGVEGLAAALLLLPGLDHLSYTNESNGA
jgi:hypothetical protein